MDRTRDGLLEWDDKEMVIRVKKLLNPRKCHHYFVNRLQDNYPDYEILNDYKELQDKMLC